MKRRHTILVVDDEPDVVQSVRDLLRLDYKVLGATKASEGVELMRQNRVDVVMTDQRMPEMTGVEFLDRIKGPHPEATRLLFTGYADIRAVIDAINQGNVYRYITKPWDPDELQTIIREACERHDLIVLKRELTEELSRANDELRAANAQLAQADKLKTAFIQVASHELRTPLTILNGYAQLAAMQPDVPAPLRDWVGRIKSGGVRLQAIVNQLVAMLEQNDFASTLRRREVQVPDLLAAAVEDVRGFVQLRNQDLVVDVPADVGTVNADAEKLRDCLNQLLLNAIKFTPDGGRITLSARPAEGGGGGGVGVAFEIADTGCGMDAASLQQFGKPFFTQFDVAHHASGTHEHDRRGLGLGACLVQKFAEMHGGRLAATSQPGAGCRVTLTIPHEAPAANGATNGSADKAGGGAADRKVEGASPSSSAEAEVAAGNGQGHG